MNVMALNVIKIIENNSHDLQVGMVFKSDICYPEGYHFTIRKG